MSGSSRYRQKLYPRLLETAHAAESASGSNRTSTDVALTGLLKDQALQRSKPSVPAIPLLTTADEFMLQSKPLPEYNYGTNTGANPSSYDAKFCRFYPLRAYWAEKWEFLTFGHVSVDSCLSRSVNNIPQTNMLGSYYLIS